MNATTYPRYQAAPMDAQDECPERASYILACSDAVEQAKDLHAAGGDLSDRIAIVRVDTGEVVCTHTAQAWLGEG